MSVASRDGNSPAWPHCSSPASLPPPPAPAQGHIRSTGGQGDGPPVHDPSPQPRPACAPGRRRTPCLTQVQGFPSLRRGQGCVRSPGCRSAFPLSARLQTAPMYALEALEARVQDPLKPSGWQSLAALGLLGGSRFWFSGSRGPSAHAGSWPHRSGALSSILTSLSAAIRSCDFIKARPAAIGAHLTPGSLISSSLQRRGPVRQRTVSSCRLLASRPVPKPPPVLASRIVGLEQGRGTGRGRPLPFTGSPVHLALRPSVPAGRVTSAFVRVHAAATAPPACRRPHTTSRGVPVSLLPRQTALFVRME